MKEQQRHQINIKGPKSSEELLIEIRNLLTPAQKQNTRKHMTSQEIDIILKESIDHYKKHPVIPGKQHLVNRAKQAVDIVQKQHPQEFVHNYTKQKVYSQLFFNLRNKLPEQQIESFQRQRQELVRQREIEEEEQRKRQQAVINSRKKFVKYQSKGLLYDQINHLRLKEGDASLPYLINQKPQKQQNSRNNLIDTGDDNKIQQTFQLMKKQLVLKSNQSRTLILDDNQTIQIVDDDQTMNQAWVLRQQMSALNKALKNSPKFVKAFKCILEKSIALYRFMNQQTSSSRNRNSFNRSETGFKYSGEPITFIYGNEKKSESVAVLTRNYKSKGVILKQMNGRPIKKAEKPICEKFISKMNGESAEFHTKKVQLKQQEIIWCEQKQEIKQDCKKIYLTVQEIQVIPYKKEEGGLFNKKTSQIEVVVVKGTKRNLKFQKNYLDGAQVYKQLCILMAQKLLELNTLISCNVNQSLSDFVNDPKAKIFSLSGNYLQDHQKYPEKDYKLMIINILSTLFAFRTQVSHIDLIGVRFNTVELGTVVKGMNPLRNLEKIQISETKFTAEILNVLFGTISQLLSKNVKLRISECFIDDMMMHKSRENIVKCVNIESLNMSKNSINIQGFGVLIELASKPECSISELNISDCKIRNLVSLGQFIKRAQNLSILYAEDCGFSFDNNEQMHSFFQCCRRSKLKKLSLLRNDPVNNFHPFQEFWVADTPKEINIEVGAFAQKTSKNLQGSLLQS